MLGGKFIAKGQYGCIFTPTLQCKDNPVKISNPSENISYSKITKTRDANYEFLIAKRMNEIPIWRNYFVIAESICSPTEVTDKDVDKCPVIEEYSLSKLKIINMINGGQSLTNYSIDLHTFDFMSFITHLIGAGALLNLNGIVHTDIHKGNILVDVVPRIIDFNLCIDIKNPVIHPHTHNINLFQEPPDFTLVNAIAGNYDAHNIIKSIVYDKECIKLLVNILNMRRDDMYKKLNQFYTENLNELDSITWFDNYWRTIDSWAIGLNILHLINQLSTSKAFIPVLHRIKGMLFPMLRRLCAISPTDRIDCVQALHYLNPKHFIIKHYSAEWLQKVTDGKITS